MKIAEIRFPNTSLQQRQYTVGNDDSDWDYAFYCHEIREIMKPGEMAMIKWFQVIRDGKVIMEVKESICDIYFE
jgi:hypothetical protein